MWYYSAMRNNSLPFVKIWMDFKYIVQNEMKQTENGQKCMILLTHEILKSENCKKKKKKRIKWLFPEDEGIGKMSFKGYKLTIIRK